MKFPANPRSWPVPLLMCNWTLLPVTVCGQADENCPAFFKKAKVVHVGFNDPPKLVKEADSEEAALNCYRRVRDEVRDFVHGKLPELMASTA